MNVLAISRMTILEAARRRLLIAIVILTLVVIAFIGWGFQRITGVQRNGQPISPAEVKLITSQLLILVAFMFSGVLALSSVLIASPSISSEIESGISLAILARPVRRWEVLLGKWLGLGVLVVAYAAGAGFLAMGVTDLVTRYVPPHPVLVAVFVAAQGLVMMTLSLLLSTRLSAMTAGVIALMGFFMSWMGGIVGGIGEALGNSALQNVGNLSTLLLPSDGLWKAAVFNMEPAAFLAVADAGPGARANPFFSPGPPPVAYLLWVAFWFVALMALGLYSFREREV